MARTMKDSGIGWIGEIPADWNTIKLCYITDDIFLGNTPVYSENENTNFIIGQKNNQETGIVFAGIKFGTDDFFGAREPAEFLRYGDILLNTLGTGSVGRIGFWDKTDGNGYITDGHIMIIRCRSNQCARFVYYSLFIRRREFEEMAVGSTNQAFLTVPKIYKQQVPFPGLDEQHRIAAYLDTECARIDALIEKTRASIEEYKKLKQSVITEAVTKGIRNGRPMKESGIEWVKSLPADWHPVNPKALFAQRKDKAIPGERQLTASQQFGVVYQNEYMELTKRGN